MAHDARPQPPEGPPNEARELWNAARLAGRSAGLIAIAAVLWALGRSTVPGWVVLGSIALIALMLGLAAGLFALVVARNVLARRFGLRNRGPGVAVLSAAMLAGFGLAVLGFWRVVVLAFAGGA